MTKISKLPILGIQKKKKKKKSVNCHIHRDSYDSDLLTLVKSKGFAH